ncbi:MAG: MoxR family ATPase [Pseudomonadota bacterium]
MSSHERIKAIQSYLNGRVIGQESLTQYILIALIADGHLLVEGAPGLAKTRTIKELTDSIEGDFHRVQFTPDLLPADLTGTEIYRQQDSSFTFQKGPIFHNLVLADEINRAPAKVQSALLEAMAERQITVGSKTYSLPELFLVMATQNPIEQEGTYPLPEAQLDRFLMHLKVDYPNAEAEKAILRLTRKEAHQDAEALSIPDILDQKTLFDIRDQALDIHMADSVEQYIVDLTMATRQPEQYDSDLRRWIDFGVSPRATIALDRCARAHAWLEGRDYVGPQDVQQVAVPVLRHRLLLTYQAEADGINSDKVINNLLDLVAIP